MTMERDFIGLSNIADECWQNAENKGWHDDEEYLQLALCAKRKFLEPRGPVIPDIIGVFIHKTLERCSLANGVQIPEKLMLIVSEATEALEVYRQSNLDPLQCYQIHEHTGEYLPYDDADPTVKPEGVGSELADIVIRVMDLSRRTKIDIVAEIRRKMRYNATRPHRHGGKRA
jgi:NTP pyrophosphatase (non-canonical NTP hydrolase)